MTRFQFSFSALVVTQGAHSVEESVDRLYDVFPPARFVSGLIALWVAIEFINGVGHPFWTIAERRYTPGVATAPLLFFLALYLARQLRAGRASVSHPPDNRRTGP